MTIGSTMARPGELTSELNQFLLRPISLLVLGYMMAYWGVPRSNSSGDWRY